MAEELKQGTDAAAAGDDAQASADAAGSTGAQATAGGADAGKTFTQADLDRIVQERLTRERGKLEKDAGKTAADLQAKLDEYEAEKQAARDAELSEVERANKAAAESALKASEAETELAAVRLSAVRANMIANDPEAAMLPAAYKALIAGGDAEALAASLTSAKAQYETDAEAIRAGGKPPPANLGTPGKVGQQPAAGGIAKEWDDNDPSTQTRENWVKERPRRGVGAPVLN